eukprot:3545715-Amphidinium_carterae.1
MTRQHWRKQAIRYIGNPYGYFACNVLYCLSPPNSCPIAPALDNETWDGFDSNILGGMLNNPSPKYQLSEFYSKVERAYQLYCWTIVNSGEITESMLLEIFRTGNLSQVVFGAYSIIRLVADILVRVSSFWFREGGGRCNKRLGSPAIREKLHCQSSDPSE